MAIRHDFKGRTDLRAFLLHKKKRRFGQAEPLTSPRAGTVQSHPQAFILALSPVKFIPSRGGMRCLTNSATSRPTPTWDIFESGSAFLQAEVCQTGPEC